MGSNSRIADCERTSQTVNAVLTFYRHSGIVNVQMTPPHDTTSNRDIGIFYSHVAQVIKQISVKGKICIGNNYISAFLENRCSIIIIGRDGYSQL